VAGNHLHWLGNGCKQVKQSSAGVAQDEEGALDWLALLFSVLPGALMCVLCRAVDAFSNTGCTMAGVSWLRDAP